ncbi:hypothetical protein A3K73_06130 [Candidatus Pacearchaeota archaeon RBG_13_36_9]|nr:MAG: hypothetical protein A3K73_06130 [Candidatus Pacearchaeota archaeon RBG_13_36_9]
MENIHIRLEFDEALFAKKELLNSQINALQTLKAFKNFKVTRKRELILRTRLRNSLSELGERIEEIEKLLPTEKDEESQLKLIKNIARKKIKFTTKKAEPKEKREYKEIERELLEIQEKLARLE